MARQLLFSRMNTGATILATESTADTDKLEDGHMVGFHKVQTCDHDNVIDWTSDSSVFTSPV
jgi:hypothetical protein